jgi:hypothetical protein
MIKRYMLDPRGYEFEFLEGFFLIYLFIIEGIYFFKKNMIIFYFLSKKNNNKNESCK